MFRSALGYYDTMVSGRNRAIRSDRFVPGPYHPVHMQAVAASQLRSCAPEGMPVAFRRGERVGGSDVLNRSGCSSILLFQELRIMNKLQRGIVWAGCSVVLA